MRKLTKTSLHPMIPPVTFQLLAFANVGIEIFARQLNQQGVGETSAVHSLPGGPTVSLLSSGIGTVLPQYRISQADAATKAQKLCRMPE